MRFRRWLPRILSDVDLFLAQTWEDRKRLIEIGAPEARVEVTGNLKFDINVPPEPPVAASLRENFLTSGASPILVHFGDSDYGNRYHLLAENIDQWRASAGSVDSVDLRFARQVVVNPEGRTVPAKLAQSAPERVKSVPKRR